MPFSGGGALEVSGRGVLVGECLGLKTVAGANAGRAGGGRIGRLCGHAHGAAARPGRACASSAMRLRAVRA